MNETPTVKTTDNDSVHQIPTPNTPKPNGNKALSWYFVAFIILIVDQVTKQFFLGKLVQEGNSLVVIDPILNWTLAYNHGAAFSFLANQGGWQKFFFAGLAFSVSIFLIWYIRKIPHSAKLLSLALAMILGGAIGNLIDRVVYGYVIDFIHVHYADIWDYPVFNIADCGIIGGVIFMVYDMLFLESKRNEADIK